MSPLSAHTETTESPKLCLRDTCGSHPWYLLLATIPQTFRASHAHACPSFFQLRCYKRKQQSQIWPMYEIMYEKY